jgi:uncharacterized protein with HEPN domain
MNESDSNRLFDMLDAARKPRQFIAGKERAILDEDEMLALAVTRLLEIIGEAARYVSEEARIECSELPWPAIVGMRHRIAHDYLHVDYDVVWDTLTIDLPGLIAVLEKKLPPETKDN